MKIIVAAVQPLCYYGDEEYLNVESVLKYIDVAADQGANLICFPEGYPGPYSGPMDSAGRLRATPIDSVCQKAKETGTYVYAGHLEENPSISDTFYLCHKLISPDGEVVANYRRTHPTHPILNQVFMGGKRHIIPGDELIVADTKIGMLGLCICSEIWAPEIPRILTLKGAEIILAPGGGAPGPVRSRLRENWHCIAFARAIENVVYVVMNQAYHANVGGIGRTAMFGPEFPLGKLTAPGVLVAEFDLDRIKEIRNRYFDEEIVSPPRSEKDLFFNRPGQIYDRRPELYRLLAQPMNETFDYRYYENGLESYKNEYERVKDFDLSQERR
jgi:predicted amidohydrolase